MSNHLYSARSLSLSFLKDALKYVVLANMLALSDINPFAAQEAIAFQVGKGVGKGEREREDEGLDPSRWLISCN